jgi:chromosome segregation ATPase
LSRKARPRFRCVNGRNCHNGGANYSLVEEAILEALKTWFEGYQVKVEVVGFSEDIERLQNEISRLEAEQEKINKQMDNAYNLVEQGVYTLELFKIRREKLEKSMESLNSEIKTLYEEIKQLERADFSLTNTIPQTERLLESYEQMSVQERNDLLKTIIKRIEYRRTPGGPVEIDLYPRLNSL